VDYSRARSAGPQAAPRTAVVWAVLRGELDRHAGRTLTVVDVGGGTGGFAVPLAQAGHEVTVVDPSPDALAALTRRAAEAGLADRVRAVQGDADGLAELIEPGSVDLVLCHSILEVVDSPTDAVTALGAVLRPGGAASVLVANRAAAVLGRALGGHLAGALALLGEPTAGGRRWFDLASAVDLLGKGGLTVEEIHGVRVVVDLVPGAVLDAEPGAAEALLRFELAASTRQPYRDVATQLHLLGRLPA